MEKVQQSQQLSIMTNEQQSYIEFSFEKEVFFIMLTDLVHNINTVKAIVRKITSFNQLQETSRHLFGCNYPSFTALMMEQYQADNRIARAYEAYDNGEYLNWVTFDQDGIPF